MNTLFLLFTLTTPSVAALPLDKEIDLKVTIDAEIDLDV